MYFEDLGARWYFPLAPDVVTVGWLEPEAPVSRGESPPAFVEALQRHLATRQYRPWMFAGVHRCEFCQQAIDTGELFIPTPAKLYLAPVMIGHYVVRHQYSPPPEFVEAVLACPAQDSDEYTRLIQRYGAICLYEGR